MDELKLKVTLEEANLVLEGLGHLPFAKVYGLVAKLQAQANRQLESPPLIPPRGHEPPPVTPASEKTEEGDGPQEEATAKEEETRAV